MAEFLDDGHTGTDFERPGFRALMAALQEKRITTFATTDLSRLGRNYLEVGLLQEKTFPALGVRSMTGTTVPVPTPAASTPACSKT